MSELHEPTHLGGYQHQSRYIGGSGVYYRACRREVTKDQPTAQNLMPSPKRFLTALLAAAAFLVGSALGLIGSLWLLFAIKEMPETKLVALATLVLAAGFRHRMHDNQRI